MKLINPFATEKWKPIQGTARSYLVSSLGRFARVNDTGVRMLRTPKMGNGYCIVNIFCKSYRAHRIVASVFCTRKNQYQDQVNHKNGIKTDNRAVNLEWVSSGENNRHAVVTKLRPLGEKHRWAKLTNKQVVEIKKSNKPYQYFMKRYSISKSCVHMIRRGESRKHDSP